MGKAKPTYDLATIKADLSSVSSLNMTLTARKTAAALGIDIESVVSIIQGMTRTMFYKSMTAHANSKVWQDVYHVPYRELTLYVKFTIDTKGHLLISFKDKNG